MHAWTLVTLTPLSSLILCHISMFAIPVCMIPTKIPPLWPALIIACNNLVHLEIWTCVGRVCFLRLETIPSPAYKMTYYAPFPIPAGSPFVSKSFPLHVWKQYASQTLLLPPAVPPLHPMWKNLHAWLSSPHARPIRCDQQYFHPIAPP